MSILTETLSRLSLGEPQAHANLALFPLLAEAPPAPEYLLLDEALDRGCARVTEVSEGGSVPELRFENACERPVLILDGEELVGAKQNRVLNLSVLAPAGRTITIPVSCVEAGRWHHSSAEFRSEGRSYYASGRASKARAVSENLAREGSRRSDQGEVWSDIDAKMARLRADSPTRAAAALFEARRDQLEHYRAAFSAVSGQTGALFAINGRFAGLDLFDRPETLAKVLPKLVGSYALDAIDFAEEGGEASREYLETVLSDVAVADVRAFPGVGLGEDLRLTAPNLSGGALLAEGRVVHLYAFPVEGQGPRGGRHHSRLARPSLRRHSQGGRIP
jgi:hypothetical protein